MAAHKQKQCPVRDCGQPIRSRAIMCRAHWVLVPVALRDVLNDENRRPLVGPHYPHALVKAIAYVNELA